MKQRVAIRSSDGWKCAGRDACDEDLCVELMQDVTNELAPLGVEFRRQVVNKENGWCSFVVDQYFSLCDMQCVGNYFLLSLR